MSEYYQHSSTSLEELAKAVDDQTLYKPDQAYQVLSFGIIEETVEIINELDRSPVSISSLEGELADGVFYVASIARATDSGDIDGVANTFLSDFSSLDEMQDWVGEKGSFVPQYKTVNAVDNISFQLQPARALAIAAIDIDKIYEQHESNSQLSGFDSLVRNNMPYYSHAALEKMPDLSVSLFNYLGGLCVIATMNGISLDNALQQKIEQLKVRERLPHVIEGIDRYSKVKSRTKRITDYKAMSTLYSRAQSD